MVGLLDGCALVPIWSCSWHWSWWMCRLEREEGGSTPANLQAVKGSSNHLSNKISLDHSECFSNASAVNKGTCKRSAVSTSSWSLASFIDYYWNIFR